MKHKDQQLPHTLTQKAPGVAGMRASGQMEVRVGTRVLKKEEAIIRAKLGKADCFGIISFRPRESHRFCASLWKKVEAFAPRTIKWARIVPWISSRVKTPRASMKKRKSKGNPSKAGDAGVPMWFTP
jgi:hypothetical protein